MFFYLLIFVIFTIIIIISLWLYFGEIDVIVKTNGIICYKENISSIYNIKSGILENIIDEDQKYVKKGTLLISIKNNSLITRRKFLRDKILRIDKEINDLKQIKNYLNLKIDKLSFETKILKEEYSTIKEKIKYLEKSIKIKNDRYKKLKNLKGLSVSADSLATEKKKITDLKFELSKYKKEKLITIENRIINKKDQILEYKIEIENIDNNLTNYKVYAPISGKIEFLKNYNKGDYIPSGIEVMKIIPDTKNKYDVQLFIKNKDILKIKKGNQIRYRIASYPYKEYGIAKGKVMNINSDSTNLDDNNYGYKIKASINNYLEKKESKKFVEYKNGMLTEASIVVKKRKIIYYVMEKLDFFD